ncbi:hypothetical protein UFOVP118_24 [uncultured Caudovirales phage]|uniref:Uncharacterized protein n=1 Tax=uncultured Caudovirales phage TaxID=2100421 RepID=A0A6J5L4L5_9CAUD|nr:hypothetical protein UFOVP118_24 [uncultured Caudovirales phage]
MKSFDEKSVHEKLDELFVKQCIMIDLMNALSKAVIQKLHEKPKKKKWVKWITKKIPNIDKNTMVRVKYADGGEWTDLVCNLTWTHLDYHNDIVAYKVVEE